MLVIRGKESQKSLVRRTLLEEGEITVQQVLYHLRDEAGNTRAITRLASIVHELRHNEGMLIAETSQHGGTATYRYIAPTPEVLPEPEPAPETVVNATLWPEDAPLINIYTQTVPCPVAGCPEILDTQFLASNPVNPDFAMVPCPQHKWQTVRVA